MTNKNIVLIAVLVLVVIGVGSYLLNQPAYSKSDTNMMLSYNPKTQGKVVFGVSDAAGDMGDISSVIITVNQVQLHNETSGWVTISNDTKQYDLLALKKSGVISLLASSTVAIGTYDQIKLSVSKVLVTKNGVQTEAKLPSGELKIVDTIVINADKTSSAVFDFIADKSLHITGDGKLIFAPVVKIKRRDDAKVEIKSNDELNIVGGHEQDDENVGMDEKGEVKDNFELKGNFKIDRDNHILFEDDAKINIKTGLNSKE